VAIHRGAHLQQLASAPTHMQSDESHSRQSECTAGSLPVVSSGCMSQVKPSRPSQIICRKSEVYFDTQRCACSGYASVCEGQRPCVSQYQNTAMGGLVCLAIVKVPSRSRSQKRSPFKPTERLQTAAIRYGLRLRPCDIPGQHPRRQPDRSPGANTNSRTPERSSK